MKSMPSMTMETIIDKAVETLRHGGTLLYPTDTIWGLGCDASNGDAVEKIYAIKQRDSHKSMLVLVLPEWIPTLSGVVREALLSSERPTTVVVPLVQLADVPISANLPAVEETIGIRVPQHELCLRLLREFGRPIVSTSANFSGCPSPRSFDEIDSKLVALVDYCVPNLPQFDSGQCVGSRVLRFLDDGSVVVLRS